MILNQLIQDLYKEAQTRSSEAFKQWVFGRLQPLVGFDSGLWVSRAEGITGSTCWFEDIVSFRQPAGFIKNLDKASIANCRANNSEESPGMQAYPATEQYEQDFCLAYGIDQVLSASIAPSAYSNTSHELHFYRSNNTDEFDAEQMKVLLLLLPNLTEAYRINVLDALPLGWQHQLPPACLDTLIKQLSKRQQTICRLLLEGLTDKLIAKALDISHHTVSNHLKSIYKVLHVDSRPQAIAFLSEKGFS